jgi:hypothetical protein
LQFFYTCGCKINNENTRKTTTTTTRGGAGGGGGATAAAAAPLQNQTIKTKSQQERKREEIKSHPFTCFSSFILVHLPNPINCWLLPQQSFTYVLLCQGEK